MLLRPMGGTEQALYEVMNRLKHRPSITTITGEKADILWQHQAHDQPCVQSITQCQNQYKAIVMVSKWQRDMYVKYLNVDPKLCHIIGNGINPSPIYEKPKDHINLYYSSTPFRGLNILAEAFANIQPVMPDVYLHVFSSMALYERSEQDVDYSHIYQKLKSTPNVRFYGVVSPLYLHNWAAQKGHILAYPNTWPETYCITTHEAMTAGCKIITTDLGALPETCPFATFYTPDLQSESKHVSKFTSVLNEVLNNYRVKTDEYKLTTQKEYADTLSWDYRVSQWQELFKKLNL